MGPTMAVQGESTKNSNNAIVFDQEEESWTYAMHLATNNAESMVLKAVIELDVLEIIKRAGPGCQLSAVEIAAQIPACRNPGAPAMLDRLLSLLASYQVLTCSPQACQPDGKLEKVYGLAPVCRFLTKGDEHSGLSLAPFVLFQQDKVILDCWYQIKEAVLEGGIPFYQMHGMSPYAHAGTDPRVNLLFNNALTEMSTLVMKRIVETYKGFEDISTLVDMGGNRGASLAMIIEKYPHVKGINFDLPHVVNDRPNYPGVIYVEGDMFVSVPEGDAIFIKSVFHNWDDEHCLKFMKNCYSALPDHGKVIACEYILPDVPVADDVTRMSYKMDVLMMIGPNGQERTVSEFEALGKASGFEGFKIASSSVYGFKIVEFLKKN